MIELDLRNMLPSLWNLVMVTLMVMIGIPLAKVLLTYVPIPGLRTLAAAV